MLEIAGKRAAELARDVDLRIGDAQALEFEDQSFDAVLITFGLCTIPDDRRAVTEAHRVLRPGGDWFCSNTCAARRLPYARCKERSTRSASASPPTTSCATPWTTSETSGSRSRAWSA
jgi:ubiquinone/menaquinone biosynthesis C-methylase UbiE